MCPSYMATRDEKHSTRGRAHALFEMLQGEVLGKGSDLWDDHDVKETLDLCLSCKACKSECPVQVDIATYKSEFMSHFYEKRMRPLNAYAFGYIDRWARMASFAPEVFNLGLKIPGVAAVSKWVLGIPEQREIPEFAPYSFVSTLRKNTGFTDKQKLKSINVMLWPDTFNNYFQPQVSESARRVLDDAGFNVVVPREHVCCGRPLYDFGFLDEAKRYMRRNLDRIGAEIDAGMPVVVLEPSCASVFRDDLKDLLPDDERAQKFSRQTYLLSEFLEKFAPEWKPTEWKAKTVVHGHCHHKALMKMTAEEAVLRRMGADFTTLDSGCCGMAGPFGFEKEKYEVSQTLANRVLLPAVRSAGETDVLLTDGFSCKEAIHQNSSRHGLHLAEVLDLANHPERDTVAPEELARRPLVEARARARRGIAVGAGIVAVAAVGAYVVARWFGRRL